MYVGFGELLRHFEEYDDDDDMVFNFFFQKMEIFWFMVSFPSLELPSKDGI